MGAELDRLEIEVEAQATKANNQLDKLVDKLDRVSSALSNLNSGGLTGLSNGVAKFAQASAQLSNVKTADFTRLTKNIQSLANLNTRQIYGAASSMKSLSTAINSLGGASAGSMQVAQVADSISQLGSASVQKAITNLPALAAAMNNFMATLAKAPQVSDNIIQMTRALANLSSQGEKVGIASKSLVKSLNSVGNSMGSNTKKVKSFASVIGSLYQQFFWVKRGIDKLWESAESSMSYVENLNYFNAAFGQVAESAVSQWEEAGYDSAEAYYNSFSDRAKELTSKMTGFNINDDGTLSATGEASLGINPSKLMNYQAMFAQMSSSMGVTSETSLKLSQALTEIGADLASVKNMDFDKVWTDMASGLAGMSRTLDKYGVNIRNVNLQQKLFDLGINENITNLNQNDKALLRTIILLDSTRYAWGDLADTLNYPANQMRLLESNISNLSRTIGNLFLPMLSKVLPYVNGLVIALQRLATWIGNLMGIDLSGITSGIGSSEVDFGGLLEDTDDLTGNLDDASNAAKKLKSNLQGFDELNVITTQQDTSGLGDLGSAGLSSGLLDAAFEDAFSEYQKTWDEAFANMENRAEEFADKIEKFFQPIKDIIGDFAVGDFFKAGKDTSQLVADIFNFFAKAIDDVDWYEIGEKIGDYLRGIDWLKILGSVGNLIWQALKASLELWSGMLSTAPLETALISLAAMPNLLKAITSSKLVTGISKLAKNFKLVTTALSGNKKSITTLSTQYPKLGKAVDVVRDSFWALKTGISDGNFWTGANLAIENIRNNLTGPQKGAITAIAGFAEFQIVSNTFEGLVDGSENLVTGIGKISGAAVAAGAAMYTALGPAGLAVAGITGLAAAVNGVNDALEEMQLESMLASLKENGTVTLEELQNSFETAISGVSSYADEAKEKISSISESKSSIEETAESIGLIVSAVQNGAYEIEQKIPDIIEQFELLLTETKKVFNEEYDVIVGNIAGAYADILEAQGASVPEMIQEFAKLRDETMSAYSALEEQAKSLEEQYSSGSISADEFWNQYVPIMQKINEFNKEGELDKTAQSLENLYGTLDMSKYIDGSEFNLNAFTDDLLQFIQVAEDGKNSVLELGEASEEYLDNILREAESVGVDTTKYSELIKEIYGANDESVEKNTQAIEAAYQQYMNVLQVDLLEQLPGVVEKATKDYDKLNPFEKIFTTKTQYVQGAIDEWQRNILFPTTTAIQIGLEKIGADGTVWADEAASKITSSLFDSVTEYSYEGVALTTTALKNNWQTIITDALNGAQEAVDMGSYGKDLVGGYVNSIINNAEASYKAIQEWMDRIDKTIHDGALEYGSPSKRLEEYGRWTTEGFDNGISSNTPKTVSMVNTYINTVNGTFSGMVGKLTEIGTMAMNGLISGMTNKEQELYTKAQSIADNIAKTIQTALDIHSPSRVMFALGKFTMEGFQLGMENLYTTIQKSVADFGGTLQYDIAPSPQLSYADIPSSSFPTAEYSNYSYYESQNNYDATETNGLLRELLSAVRAGQVIECNGREIGKTIRDEDREYYNRTGKGMFQH